MGHETGQVRRDKPWAFTSHGQHLGFITCEMGSHGRWRMGQRQSCCSFQQKQPGSYVKLHGRVCEEAGYPQHTLQHRCQSATPLDQLWTPREKCGLSDLSRHHGFSTSLLSFPLMTHPQGLVLSEMVGSFLLLSSTKARFLRPPVACIQGSCLPQGPAPLPFSPLSACPSVERPSPSCANAPAGTLSSVPACGSVSVS